MRHAGWYSQLLHLLHAHRHAAGLLGNKPAPSQAKPGQCTAEEG